MVMELVQRKNNYKLHPKETVVNKTEREGVCADRIGKSVRYKLAER